MIGLEVNGPACLSVCQSVVSEQPAAAQGMVFVSSSTDTAKEQVEAFYNFADMQMGV